MIVDCAVYTNGLRQPGPPLLTSVPTEGPTTFTWLGLRMPSDAELQEVAEAFQWSDFAVADVLTPHARPVLTVDAEMVRLVLRTARYDDKQELVSLGEMSVLVTPNAVVSIRYGLASPLAQLRRDMEAEPARLGWGPYAVLAAIVTRVVDDYVPTLDGFENDVLEVERDVFSDGRRQPSAGPAHLSAQASGP